MFGCRPRIRVGCSLPQVLRFLACHLSLSLSSSLPVTVTVCCCLSSPRAHRFHNASFLCLKIQQEWMFRFTNTKKGFSERGAREQAGGETIGKMKMTMMMMTGVVAVVVVVTVQAVCVPGVDASWAPHNHEYRRRGRGGARYYYYNTLLQRAQRHKPEELRKYVLSRICPRTQTEMIL